MEIDLLSKFTVTKELKADAKIEKVGDLLLEDESVEHAYTHVRDRVWFTNKRIITMDVQGLMGKKREFRSFPYSKVSSFSVETAGGIFDVDSDFKIWVSGVGLFEINFYRKLDIKQIKKYLSNKIL